jgi:ferredoxin
MVFYFTGTGNSMYVAKQLEKKCISIPQAVHDVDVHYKDETIGIVCPVYGHEMPQMVKDFLKRSVFMTDYFYLVLTYGRIHGGAAELSENVLSECGIRANYINSIMMVDNYLPVFDMNEEMRINPEKEVEKNLAKIKADITARIDFKQEVTEDDREFHRKFLEMSKEQDKDVWGKPYIVNDDCIGCGICMRVCPAGCIHMVNQRAVHTYENCQMCMACIHTCPQKAIGLKMQEKNPDARYRNENVGLMELIRANEQRMSATMHTLNTAMQN